MPGPYTLKKSTSALAELKKLADEKSMAGRLKAVDKALKFLAQDPSYPALKTKGYKGTKCPHNDTLFEAYAENNRPGAYRIFFCYPPDEKAVIWIVDIVPHPD